jgi:hypothetical protein
MSYALYISGPGIVGHLLMQTLPGPKPMVYATAIEARIQQELLAADRPYHVVSVAPYKEGQEETGHLSADPDGVT